MTSGALQEGKIDHLVNNCGLDKVTYSHCTPPYKITYNIDFANNRMDLFCPLT